MKTEKSLPYGSDIGESGSCFELVFIGVVLIVGVTQLPDTRNHLNTGQVWYLNGPNMSGCQMVLFLNGGLKTGLIWTR